MGSQIEVWVFRVCSLIFFHFRACPPPIMKKMRLQTLNSQTSCWPSMAKISPNFSVYSLLVWSSGDRSSSSLPKSITKRFLNFFRLVSGVPVFGRPLKILEGVLLLERGLASRRGVSLISFLLGVLLLEGSCFLRGSCFLTGSCFLMEARFLTGSCFLTGRFF